MISQETEAHILRLHHAEGWPVGTIAFELDVHHSAVSRVLEKTGLPRPGLARASIADPYMPFILETLKRHPRLTSSRLYYMVKERGYPGKRDHFRTIVGRYRPPRVTEAYLRLKTLIGEQGQADWAHFGSIAVGRAVRKLVGFVMVLSWSRAIFLRFFLGQQLSNFLRGHEEAFKKFGAVPRVILLDNLKSAVLERMGQAIRFNPAYLSFSGHYHFEPRPVAVARGNQKGRVERSIRYIRGAFFEARKWHDLEDLNYQADEWCNGEAMERPWRDDNTKTVGQAYEEERGKLLPLPGNFYPTEDRVEVIAGKTPYVRFDLNDYSVPHEFSRRTLVLVADLKEVRILNGLDVVAVHPRSFDKGSQIEDPSHVQRLEEWKRAAQKHRGMDRLNHSAPSTVKLLNELALRGQHLGSAVSQLLRLLDTYGAEAFENAVKEALERGVPHPHAVRHALERWRQAEGKPAVLPLDLPDDPRVRDLNVKPHSLDIYDNLKEQSDADNDTGI
jgi:transposase